MFCNVKQDCVIENITLPCLYEAPLMLEKANFSAVVCRELGIRAKEAELSEWTDMVNRIKKRRGAKTYKLKFGHRGGNHPESAPGPQDSIYLFDRFGKMMEENRHA